MGQWETVDISGKAAEVFEPTPADPRFALVFLHGHGRITLAQNPVFTSLLNEAGLRCVCPHGQRSWWSDFICQEFDPAITPAAYLRDAALPWICARWNVSPPGIGLFGVSMGGQGALRLAYRHPKLFPVVAALSPAVNLDLMYGRGYPIDEIYPTAEAARQDSATLHIHPLNWPRHQWIGCDPDDAECFDGVTGLVSKLDSTGIPFERDLTTTGGGHGWTFFNAQAPEVLSFLKDRLEQESRRV